jgi:hypothetical protein
MNSIFDESTSRKRTRFDTQGINVNSQLMYKEGFAPRCPDRCNSAGALSACGWRTAAQIEKAKNKKKR